MALQILLGLSLKNLPHYNKINQRIHQLVPNNQLVQRGSNFNLYKLTYWLPLLENLLTSLIVKQSLSLGN